MTNLRAIRYRRLALAEQDAEAARLLCLIADEPNNGFCSILRANPARLDHVLQPTVVVTFR